MANADHIKALLKSHAEGDGQRDRGQLTSWSASIDALGAGRSFDMTSDGIVFTGTSPSRLFVISAGNASMLEHAHLDRSDLEPVEDPAQAWNALTVGACTERAVLDDEHYDALTPLATSGDLSPYSTSSVGFAAPWPVKLDLVMEGGNIGINGSDEVHDEIPDLLPLTTYYKPQDKPLVTTWGTSAACSSAARLCMRVMADYLTLEGTEEARSQRRRCALRAAGVDRDAWRGDRHLDVGRAADRCADRDRRLKHQYAHRRKSMNRAFKPG